MDSPLRAPEEVLPYRPPCLWTSGLRSREDIFVVLSHKCVLSLLQHPKEVTKLENPIYFASLNSIYTFQSPILTVLRGHAYASVVSRLPWISNRHLKLSMANRILDFYLLQPQICVLVFPINKGHYHLKLRA